MHSAVKHCLFICTELKKKKIILDNWPHSQTHYLVEKLCGALSITTAQLCHNTEKKNGYGFLYDFDYSHIFSDSWPRGQIILKSGWPFGDFAWKTANGQ